MGDLRKLKATMALSRSTLRTTRVSASRTKVGRVRSVVRASAPPSANVETEAFDPKKFRRKLTSQDNYTRKTLNDGVAIAKMEEEGIGAVSQGGLIGTIKEAGGKYKRGEITVALAEAYGFCWGVERAVQMAYEARQQFPSEKLWITNEIIHNPTVNQRLADMDIHFIEGEGEQEKDFSGVEGGDVVILPAFGASVHEMKLLDDRGVNIVDTTCPWVSKVWNAVDVHKKKSYTSIIHGKYGHEETIATASFATIYLIVKNEKEAQYVIDYIHADAATRAELKPEFMEKFKKAMSKGFDPDVDLEAVGLANQTTMLKGETEAVGKMFEKAMMQKYGVENLKQHYMVLDTICDATQERQDAMNGLVDVKPDLMIVVGGYNSSNTQHLQEIAELENIPSFWVDTCDRIREDGSIEHLMSWGELRESNEWLPSGPITIGVTSGASTPNKVVEDCLARIFAVKEASQAKLEPV